MPLGKRHVVLAFEEPVPIERVRLSGEALTSAEILVASIDPVTGIEGKDQAALGRRTGKMLAWETRDVRGADRVNTIRIFAELAPETTGAESRKLRLSIDSGTNEVLP
jgi:hypothetical protein